MSDQTTLEIAATLAAKTTAAAATTYAIPITIRNASSVGFKKAEVAVKDEDYNQVATAYFGRIESKSTQTQNVQLPSGVESCLFKIWPDVGDELIGGGLADNAPGVNITISD